MAGAIGHSAALLCCSGHPARLAASSLALGVSSECKHALAAASKAAAQSNTAHRLKGAVAAIRPGLQLVRNTCMHTQHKHINTT